MFSVNQALNGSEPIVVYNLFGASRGQVQNNICYHATGSGMHGGRPRVVLCVDVAPGLYKVASGFRRTRMVKRNRSICRRGRQRRSTHLDKMVDGKRNSHSSYITQNGTVVLVVERVIGIPDAVSCHPVKHVDSAVALSQNHL